MDDASYKDVSGRATFTQKKQMQLQRYYQTLVEHSKE